MTDTDAEGDGPEFEVWNHLESGIDMAAMELRTLDPQSRSMAEKLAKAIVAARGTLSHQPDSIHETILSLDAELLSDPWIRHAAEIEIAHIAIWRARTALERYLSLRPVIAAQPIPPRAQRYVTELINTFAFGFDAACIALGRAVVEQLLKDSLVARGEYTEARLKRERPTAGALLVAARRAGILARSSAAAEGLVKKGDTVLHQFLYDERVSEQQARDTVAQLLEVLAEVLEDGRDQPQTAT